MPQLEHIEAIEKRLWTAADTLRANSNYASNEYFLPRQTDALKVIAEWVAGGERVALTCYEHLPGQCHRHCVSEALEKHLGSKYDTRHL